MLEPLIQKLIELYLFDIHQLSQPWMYYLLFIPFVFYLLFFIFKWILLTLPVWLPMVFAYTIMTAKEVEVEAKGVKANAPQEFKQLN